MLRWNKDYVIVLPVFIPLILATVFYFSAQADKNQVLEKPKYDIIYTFRDYNYNQSPHFITENGKLFLMVQERDIPSPTAQDKKISSSVVFPKLYERNFSSDHATEIDYAKLITSDDIQTAENEKIPLTQELKLSVRLPHTPYHLLQDKTAPDGFTVTFNTPGTSDSSPVFPFYESRSHDYNTTYVVKGKFQYVLDDNMKYSQPEFYAWIIPE